MPTGAADEVLELLAHGVPMTLLADLSEASGPPSPVILEEEGLPAEAWWEPQRDAGAQGAEPEPASDA